jgi:hypothetical protein
MAKFNDAYLKPALDSLKGSAGSIIDGADAVTNRINAESVSVNNRSLAELTFRRNLSVGYKILLILIGAGLLGVLLAWGASIIINSLKEDPSTGEKLKKIEQHLIVSDNKFGELSKAISDEADGASAISLEQRKTLDAISKQTLELSKELTEIKSKLSSVPLEVTEKQANYSDYALEKFPENPKSINCFDNKSYSSSCNDTVEFPNGWTYSGLWLNGQPEGEGTLKFQEGIQMEAVWKAGIPTAIKNDKKNDVKLLKSITYFQTFPTKKLNSKFKEVVIGYRFDSGADQTWESAYCYLEVLDGSDNLNVSLSYYPSFNGKLIKYNYISNSKYSLSEFKSAQNLCEYRRSGFN